jgi:hypothetical protein
MQNPEQTDIGQLFMVGLPTPELDSSTLQLIADFQTERTGQTAAAPSLRCTQTGLS